MVVSQAVRVSPNHSKLQSCLLMNQHEPTIFWAPYFETHPYGFCSHLCWVYASYFQPMSHGSGSSIKISLYLGQHRLSMTRWALVLNIPCSAAVDHNEHMCSCFTISVVPTLTLARSSRDGAIDQPQSIQGDLDCAKTSPPPSLHFYVLQM